MECAIRDYAELAQKQLAQKGADYSDRKAVDAAHNTAHAIAEAHQANEDDIGLEETESETQAAPQRAK